MRVNRNKLLANYWYNLSVVAGSERVERVR